MFRPRKCTRFLRTGRNFDMLRKGIALKKAFMLPVAEPTAGGR